MKPVLVVGAGPIGLITALALKFYGLPFRLFEEDGGFSSDTKAGTILTRTIEAFRRYGVAESVLARALRLDEIGEIERATNVRRASVLTALLAEETRFPFVVNLPQHHLEPILAEALEQSHRDSIRLGCRLKTFVQKPDGVAATFATVDGEETVEGSYLLACDGGRSAIRAQLGVAVEGKSLDIRYMLVDVRVDLDVADPRDYPYLAYFSDPAEWMILVRQPHCWRFLFPLAADAQEASREELAHKVRRFVGEVRELEVLNTVVYRVHHRIATRWRADRVFLMGDAAHLITPMWALGLNTGVLDALNLPWRLAWVLRGWASDALLDGYEREQMPLASKGSGEMAEAAARLMSARKADTPVMAGSDWANAMTRSLLGVRLDVEGAGAWSLVKTEREALRVGDRLPDMRLFAGDGSAVMTHDLGDDRFVAYWFTDVRRRPAIPDSALPGLRSYAVSRWDAPLDSGLRDRALFDVGDRFKARVGCADDTIVLVRPDDHVAAILPLRADLLEAVYAKILGRGEGAAR
jgi:3-(3-hydroxy-phenyl)propionate hydroxylase